MLACYYANQPLTYNPEEVIEEYGDDDELEVVVNETVGASSATKPGILDNASGSREVIPLNPVTFPSMAIDATAQFLVDRVKEELLLAFFDQFLENIDKSVELQALLPNTQLLLNKQDIFRVPSMGKVWTTAFREDLNNFNSNLTDLVMQAPQYADIRKDPIAQAFLLMAYSHEEFRKGFAPLDVFDKLQNKFGREKNQVGIAISLVDLFLDNMKSESGDYLMEISTFNKLNLNGGRASLYFSGLLFQQNQVLFETVKVGGQPLSSIIESNHLKFTDHLSNLIVIAENIKMAKLNFDATVATKLEKPKVHRKAFFDYMGVFVHLIDFGFDTWYFNTPELVYQSDYQTLYRPIIDNSLWALQAEAEGDHASTILYTLQIMEPITTARIQILEQKIKNEDNGDQVKTYKKQLKVTHELVRNIAFYGGFMIDVLSSKSATDIKGIINKYAAPVGSYRVKRQSSFSLSLSAYPGIQSGFERIIDTDKYGPVTGVTAPIGPSLNMGLGNGRHSLSLFLPIIDIGAAFSYRWKNESEGFPADLKWEQVLSPGGHLAWGLPKAPIAIMGGIQYTPKLREVTATGTDIQSNTLRFSLSATVDIPVVHFYKSGKRNANHKR